MHRNRSSFVFEPKGFFYIVYVTCSGTKCVISFVPSLPVTSSVLGVVASDAAEEFSVDLNQTTANTFCTCSACYKDSAILFQSESIEKNT